MASIRYLPMTLIALVVLLLCLPAYATRNFDQRRDLADVPPVTASGWSVPLDGSHTCGPDGECWNSLEAPPSDKVLQVLAVGRGVFNYSCEAVDATDPPTFVDQYTELYNAAPLIPTLPNEQAFHDLIPGLCDFNYGELHNSTLEYLGTIGILNGSAVLTLYDIVTFETILEQKLAAPDEPTSNGLWARSRSLDHTWEMYRVEMAGGAVPATCEGLNGSFEVNYAAEYWFYHIQG